MPISVCSVSVNLLFVQERCFKLIIAPDNFLYDKDTMRLTALLDFDFSHVASFADEFFRSLCSDIGQFPSSRDSEGLVALRNAMLTGFPDPLPQSNDEVQWPSARAWNDALCERNAQKPSSIKDIALLSDMFWLSGQILPFKLCNPIVVKNSSSSQLLTRKKAGEENLIKFLNDYGY